MVQFRGQALYFTSMTSTKYRKYFALLLALLLTIILIVAIVPDPVMAATLTIDDDSLTTDNGAITGVTVDVSGEITWDGAEETPGSTEIELQVQNPDSSWMTVTANTEDLSGLAGTHNYSFLGVDIISNSDWKQSDFTANGDGATTETDLTFRLNIDTSGDLDGSGSSNTIQSGTDTATLTVTNEKNSNSAGGSGGINGGGTNNEP